MEALWKARPYKDSQIQCSMSAGERVSDAEVGAAPPSPLVGEGVPNNDTHNSQPATLGSVAKEQQDMSKASSPRKRPRAGTDKVQKIGSEAYSLHSDDSDNSDDSSFYKRVMRIKQLYDDGPQVGEPEPPPIASEVLVAISRSSSIHATASGPLDAPTPVKDLKSTLPSHSQSLEDTIHHGRKSEKRNTASNADSVQVRNRVLYSPCTESDISETQVSLGSDAFLSSPSSQTGQHFDTRATSINQRKRAFQAASGDSSADWASSSARLHCLGDHHTQPEVELD